MTARENFICDRVFLKGNISVPDQRNAFYMSLGLYPRPNPTKCYWRLYSVPNLVIRRALGKLLILRSSGTHHHIGEAVDGEPDAQKPRQEARPVHKHR